MPLTVLKTILTVKEIIFRLLPRYYAVYIQQYPQYISDNIFDRLKTKWLKCKQEVLSAHVQKAKQLLTKSLTKSVSPVCLRSSWGQALVILGESSKSKK